MDRGAWRATVHRVTRGQTQLKQLSVHTYKPFYSLFQEPEHLVKKETTFYFYFQRTFDQMGKKMIE